MIEIIAVMIILTIIGAVVLSRMTETCAELIGKVDAIKSHLRYAQSPAMNSDIVWGIRCNGIFYWLFSNGNINNRVILPGEDADRVNLRADGFAMERFTLSFDSWGVPHRDAAASDGQELVKGHPETQLTVSYGSQSESITVTPLTGFIP